MGQLAGANGLIVVLAFVTSPILARALGPSGRGDLAAIFVVLGLAPTIADVGLYVFVSRERARGYLNLGTLLGSILPVGLAASMIGVALAYPIAHVIGRGRDTVTLFVELGLWLLPLSVFLQTLFGVLVGDQRWNIVVFSKIFSATGNAVAIVALSLSGLLSVTTVAVAFLLTGLAANLPFLAGLHGARPLRFEKQIARTGLAFGARSWLSSLATQTNAKLDQLLMAAVVSSRELGLYALAVTLSTASTSLTSAVSNALLPRVAGGEVLLAARVCRTTTALVAAYGVVFVAASPFLVPAVFGSAFSETVPMLAVLLAANVLLVPGQVLGAALIAAGHPGSAARSQLVGLLVTVPALLIALPLAGGTGAALVSLVSYSASLYIVVAASAREFDIRPRELLVANTGDLRWFGERFRRSRAKIVRSD